MAVMITFCRLADLALDSVMLMYLSPEVAFSVTRGSTSKLLPMAFGVSVNKSDGFTAPHVADDRTDARTYNI